MWCQARERDAAARPRPTHRPPARGQPPPCDGSRIAIGTPAASAQPASLQLASSRPACVIRATAAPPPAAAVAPGLLARHRRCRLAAPLASALARTPPSRAPPPAVAAVASPRSPSPRSPSPRSPSPPFRKPAPRPASTVARQGPLAALVTGNRVVEPRWRPGRYTRLYPLSGRWARTCARLAPEQPCSARPVVLASRDHLLRCRDASSHFTGTAVRAEGRNGEWVQDQISDNERRSPESK